ncbi:hypothetical protein WAE31_10975 (plasmid) [Xanthomonas axonopodis pv. vasculorum]
MAEGYRLRVAAAATVRRMNTSGLHVNVRIGGPLMGVLVAAHG